MLRTLLIPTLLAASLPGVAQDALDRIAQKTCSCVAGLKDVTDVEERNTQMGLCMLAEAGQHEKELKRKHGFDMSRIDTDGEALGRAVGMRMAKYCPDVLVALAGQGEDVPPPPPSAERTLVGELTEVRKGELLTLVVRAATGSTYELLVLGPVVNGGPLLADPQAAIGRSLGWTYIDTEIYDVRSGTFRSHRVLQAIPE